VRRKERRLYRDRKALTEPARRPQHLRLIGQRESVAGFDLDRRHPFAQEHGQARRCVVDELLETCLPRRPHGGEDPAAAGRDLRVGGAAQPFGIFAGTRAREHQVRMTIDEPRGNPHAMKIMALEVCPAQIRRLLAGGPEPGDATVAHGERAFFDHAHALIAGGDAGIVPEAHGVGIRRFRHDAPMLAVLLAIHGPCRILLRAWRQRRRIRRHSMIYDSILGTIGRTPIVRLQRLAPKNVVMYVKCEFFNPASSVKDRLAIAIIEDAEKSGKLKPGQTVVEATSGNTGIALAMVCAAKGYPFVAVMAESFSIERRKIMRLLGAKVILTPAAERGTGMVKKAEELSKKHGWFLARQFENPANPAYHRNTTGPEILSDFAGRRLDAFVTGWGTGGTLTGVGEMMKVARPEVKIVVAEPHAAALLSGKPFTPHKIQGWTPDFVPAVLNRDVVDRILTVTDAEAIEGSRALAKSEGIFCGISSGATFAAARKVAEESPAGAVILAMLPDTAERYLSTPLFEGIAEGSDPEP
jgi:cysteine synthase A